MNTTIEQQAEEKYPFPEESEWSRPADIGKTKARILALRAAYLAGASAMNGSAGVQWVELKDGQPLPNYDEPVIWLFSDGHFCIDQLDKDSNRNKHIFNEYRSGWDGDGVLVKRTHWHKIPPLPNESVSFPSQQVGSAGVHTSIDALNVKPTICERFADNGAHSHWDLIDTETGGVLWTEDSESVSSPSPLEAETADKDRTKALEDALLRIDDLASKGEMLTRHGKFDSTLYKSIHQEVINLVNRNH